MKDKRGVKLCSYTLIFSDTVPLRWRRNTSYKRYCTSTVKVYKLCILIRLCEHNKITCESSLIRYNIINYNSNESFRSFCILIESIDGFAVSYAFIWIFSLFLFTTTSQHMFILLFRLLKFSTTKVFLKTQTLQSIRIYFWLLVLHRC